MLKKVFDEKLLKFVLVGIVNTAVGTFIMFFLYNVVKWGYFASSAANYILTSILSFFLNKYFTFKSHGDMAKSAVRFTINIAVCYLLAYGIAKPLVVFLLTSLPDGILNPIENVMYSFLSSEKAVEENLAMIVGMCLFVLFNYFGQRFFAFKSEE